MKKPDKKKLLVRALAIVMTALMLLSVFAILFNTVFASDVNSLPATGSDGMPKWPIFAVIGAILIIVLCVVLPKIKKKK
ncbi:MAG: hypothetical protein FWF05_07880 [Oscillospiraceae bacterium]|nr:hypothetical protein [Oscillospiraceae bacterium]